jgi:hypothetical protein
MINYEPGQALEELHSINAGLWCLVADANDAKGWEGQGDDFDRAEQAESGSFEISEGRHAVVVTVGSCGWSHAGTYEVFIDRLGHEDPKHGTLAQRVRIVRGA